MLKEVLKQPWLTKFFIYTLTIVSVASSAFGDGSALVGSFERIITKLATYWDYVIAAVIVIPIVLSKLAAWLDKVAGWTLMNVLQARFWEKEPLAKLPNYTFAVMPENLSNLASKHIYVKLEGKTLRYEIKHEDSKVARIKDSIDIDSLLDDEKLSDEDYSELQLLISEGNLSALSTSAKRALLEVTSSRSQTVLPTITAFRKFLEGAADLGVSLVVLVKNALATFLTIAVLVDAFLPNSDWSTFLGVLAASIAAVFGVITTKALLFETPRVGQKMMWPASLNIADEALVRVGRMSYEAYNEGRKRSVELLAWIKGKDKTIPATPATDNLVYDETPAP